MKKYVAGGITAIAIALAILISGAQAQDVENTQPDQNVDQIEWSVCPGSGYKCVEVLWGAATVYKGQGKPFIE